MTDDGGGRVRPLSRGMQLLLQRLVASHVLTDSDARALYDSIKESAEDDGGADLGDMGRDLEHCLGVMNASLGPAFGLEVRTVALSRGVAPPRPIEGGEVEAQKEKAAPEPAGSSGRKKSRGRGRRRGDADADDDATSASSGVATSTAGNGNGELIKYHAVINKHSDDVAKAAANHGPHARNPHELALFRLILERIVERYLDDAENRGGDDASSAAGGGKGCDAALRRMEAINLRTELDGPHRGKLHIGDAEKAIGALVSEGWLVPAASRPGSDAPTPEAAAAGAEDEAGAEGGGEARVEDGAALGEGDQEGGGASASTPSPGGRRTSSRKRTRRSLDGLGAMDDTDADASAATPKDPSSGDVKAGNYLMIGPRTYMELPEVLVDLGLGRDRMPQFILHSAR